jgi:hypothetical protein
VSEKIEASAEQGGHWQTIETAPEGVAVMTKIDDAYGVRNEQLLVKRTRIPGETRPLFWFADGSMYVYYEPTHWRPAEARS